MTDTIPTALLNPVFGAPNAHGQVDLLTSVGNKVQVRNPRTNAVKTTLTPLDGVTGGLFIG